MIKYTAEKKNGFKQKLLEEFDKLSAVQKTVAFQTFSEAQKYQEGSGVISPDSVFGKTEDEKKQKFGELIDSFFEGEDEQISNRLKNASKLTKDNFKDLKSTIDSFVKNVQQNNQQEQNQNAQQEPPNNQVNAENVQGQERGPQINPVVEGQNQSGVQNQNVEPEQVNQGGLNQPEDSQVRERRNALSRRSALNARDNDQIIVSGNPNINIIENYFDPSRNSSVQSSAQSANNSLEEDLYSKIMNINLNRASLVNDEISTNKNYHEFSDDEIANSKLKLNSIIKNALQGATSFDALNDSEVGRAKLNLLKHFDDPKNITAYSEISESIPFQPTDYKLNNKTKTSEIKSPEGHSIGSLEKTERTIKVDGKDVKVWQAKLNLGDSSNGYDIAAKLYLYDDKGQQSDLSIIIGKDKSGKPIISAQLDIESGKGDDLVKLKRDGKTYVMPITYNDYEKYHEAMLNKTQFKDMNLSKNLEANKAQQQDKDVAIVLPKINMQQLGENNRQRSNSMVFPRSPSLLENKGQVQGH